MAKAEEKWVTLTLFKKPLRPRNTVRFYYNNILSVLVYTNKLTIYLGNLSPKLLLNTLCSYLIFINTSSNVTDRAIRPATEDGPIKNPIQLVSTSKKEGRYVQRR